MTGSLPSIPPSVGATAKNRPHLSQIPVSQNLDSASSLTPRFRAILGNRSVTVAAPIRAPRGTSVPPSARVCGESEAQ
jgi:hypothetical protein